MRIRHLLQQVLIGMLDISWQVPAKLAEAGIAALMCGFLGAWGKHLFTFAMRKIKNTNKMANFFTEAYKRLKSETPTFFNKLKNNGRGPCGRRYCTSNGCRSATGYCLQ